MSTKAQSEVLHACQEKILKAAPKITDRLIEQAEKGSYQHAKFLFDLALSASGKSAEKDDEVPGPPLADIILQRFGEFLEMPPDDEEDADDGGEPRDPSRITPVRAPKSVS